ncbi:hypothetical protein DXG01_003973 [Tephrocybe rancida]|nr:hypothetical protein DXG01_003973 [Tephrocybe rancida]
MADLRRYPEGFISLATQTVYLSLYQSFCIFAFTGSNARSMYGELEDLAEKIEVSIFSWRGTILELKQTLAQKYPACFSYDLVLQRLLYVNLGLTTQNGGASHIEIVFSPASAVPAYLHTINGLPVVPYPFILLQELMLWDSIPPAEAQSRKPHVSRILRMLNVLRHRQDFVHRPEFDLPMQAASIDRTARFFAAHPSFRKEWQRLGVMPHRERGVEKPNVADQGAANLVAALETMTITPGTAGPSPGPSNAPARPAVEQKKKAKQSRTQIRRIAARTTVQILEAHGFPCALFGSMACKLYGNKRIPNDIDVLVLPLPNQTINDETPTQELLKDLLVSSAPESFVLRPARDPEATYRVLYFRPTPTAKPTPHQSSKVDILLPGVMHLPALRPGGVSWRDLGGNDGQPEPSVPVVPFSVLLLQKLQAWDDHRSAEEEHYRKKAPVDVEDLQWMLRVGVARYVRGAGAATWRDRALFDEEFEGLSRERVRAFCAVYPRWTGVWRGMGFEVP